MSESFDRRKLLKIVRPPIKDFEACLKKEGLTDLQVVTDLGILHESFIRVYETMDQGFKPNSEPSSFKLAGSICYWFKRLQPFSLGKSSDCHQTAKFINEIIAILISYYLVFGDVADKKGFELPKLTDRFFNDFLASLRYYQQSPQSLGLLFEALSLGSK